MFYKVVGLMSGTSLDGLDIAYCEFEEQSGNWSYKIIEAETVPYSEEFRKRVIAIENASAVDFSLFDVELGYYFGRLTREFIDKHSL
ncbi:MAG: anhydro-N-acetylmuramic acid kinase, partial [Bacteroidales bacterium]|nr:anhydro-N-acetylmuramic acid kinase [Bacteroidales bacterium]